MIIKTIGEPNGVSIAIYAMRHPFESYHLSDSYLNDDNRFVIGEKDKDLSLRLQKAGTEHCKHLRMIHAFADITAGLHWHKQMDTYRIGVEKISCSTMHKLMARPLTEDDFENDCMNKEYMKFMLDSINGSMEAYRLCKDQEYKQEIWRGIIEALPESYLQTRTYMFSYAALRNIVHQREGHRLHEWKQFIDWVHTLPYAELFIFDNERKD